MAATGAVTKKSIVSVKRMRSMCGERERKRVWRGVERRLNEDSDTHVEA